jgi:hypothetical protein
MGCDSRSVSPTARLAFSVAMKLLLFVMKLPKSVMVLHNKLAFSVAMKVLLFVMKLPKSVMVLHNKLAL